MSRAERARRYVTRLDVLAVLVALVPVVVAVGRKWQQRWVPIGDNALIELRSRDVFSTGDFPFLGTWSSASLTAGKDLNHPGPLLFDLLAIPVRLFGGPRGIALGVGLINAAAIIGIAVAAHRIRGRSGALAATLIAAALAWTLGSGMLTDPWNPHVLVLPCLALFVLVWGVASGQLSLLPWLIVVGSLCLHTHLGYAYLVPAMTLVALLGAGAVYRRRWRADRATRGGDLAMIRRWGLVSVGVLIVVWLQPIIEQIVGDGQGNLARIATSTGSDEPVVGARLGVRIVASLVALPPWWSRSSFTEAVQHTPYAADGVAVNPAGLPSFGLAVFAVVAVFAVLSLLGWRAAVRADRPGVMAVAVAAAALVVALATFAVMPIGPLGLTPHQMRWLWSLGAFVALAVVVAALPMLLAILPPMLSPMLSRVPDDHLAATGANVSPAPPHRRVEWVLAAAVVVVSAVNVPGFTQLAGPDTFQESVPVARALSEQVDDYTTDEAVVLDTANLRYLEPYSAVVMAAMLRAGVDLRVVDPGLVRQLGNNRRADGDEPLVVSLVEGRPAFETPEGVRRIAFTTPLDAATITELIEGEMAMIDTVALNGVTFTEDGERDIAAGAFGLSRDEIEVAAADAAGFVYGGLAAELVAAGTLDLSDVEPAVAAQFERTSALRRQVGTTTVAVWVRPNAATG